MRLRSRCLCVWTTSTTSHTSTSRTLRACPSPCRWRTCCITVPRAQAATRWSGETHTNTHARTLVHVLSDFHTLSKTCCARSKQKTTLGHWASVSLSKSICPSPWVSCSTHIVCNLSPSVRTFWDSNPRPGLATATLLTINNKTKIT